MDAISPRALTFFSDPGSPKRPSSRASSTGTEVPGVPRSLAREVEHIKSLISRANLSSKQNEGSITATIFRLGARQENITQAHILHELDTLKRRIRAETRPVPKRQIDDDPETETESEAEDVVDERDEELDSIREELQLVREQREKWIEAAEERVDRLTDEKEELEKQLQGRQKELSAALERQEGMTAKQKKHEATLAELKSTHAKQFRTLNDTRLKNLERERDSALRNLEDKDSYIESLEQDVKDLKSEVDEERRAAAAQDNARKSAEDELKKQHAEELDYVRHSAELGLSKAKEQHGGQIKSLQEEHEKALSQQAQKHDSAIRSLKLEHDDLISTTRSEHASTIAGLQTQHTAELQTTKDKAADEVEELRTSHEKKLQDQDQQHQTELRKLDETHTSHRDKLAKSQETEIAALRDESASIKSDLEAKHTASVGALRKEHAENARKATEAHDVEMTKTKEAHDFEMTKVRESHAQEADRLRADREAAVKASAKGAADETQSLIAELDKRHEAEREKWQNSLSALEQEMQLKLHHAQQEKHAAVAEIEAQHRTKAIEMDDEMKKQQADHKQEIAALETRHLDEKNNAAKSAEDNIRQILDNLTADITEGEEAHASAIREIEEKLKSSTEDAEKKYNVLKEEHAAEMRQVNSTRDEEATKLRRQHQDEVQRLKDSNIATLESASRTHLDNLNGFQLKHHEKVAELQEKLASSDADHTAMQEKLEKLEASNSEAIKTLEDRLKQERESQLQSLRDEHLASNTATESKHREAMREAVEQANVTTQAANEESQKTLRAQLNESVQASHKQYTEALEALKDSHTREVADLKSELTASQEEAERVRQEHANLSTNHAAEVARLYSEHEAALVKLQADHSDKEPAAQSNEASATDESTRSKEITKDDATAGAEENKVAELQIHIDSLKAEVLEHHQARNHLEGMLQQKTHEAIQATEESKQASRKHTALEAELQSLRTTHERTEHSLRELQETIMEHQTLSTGETSRMEEELEGLRTQISAAQKEKASVQSDIDSKSTERSELALQNDFLTKQLSELGALMNGSTKKAYASRGMQTAPRIDVIGSPKRSHRRNVSLQEEGVASPSRSKRSSLVFGPELGNSIVGSPLARTQQTSARPSTPDNPIVSTVPASGSPGTDRRRTLQHYLEKSETPLFEPGSVATANEALLARKIQEHVGDMQKARDTLAKEYQGRFDALLREKERLDKQVTMDQAADFVKEREQLASQFLAAEQEEVMSSTPRPKMIQGAEQRLVQKYNRRIAKKKSQIRLQHAEDFHNLTQDYDRRLADLLFQKSEMESDLGFGQSAIDSDETIKEPKSLRSEPGTDDAVSRLPKRSLTSIPRSRTSIPRMASFTKDKDVLQVAKPRLERSPSSESRHPPVRQRSLMRLKSPPEGPPTRRSSLIDSDSPLRPLASENPDSDYAGDADEFDKHGRGLKRQSGSPNIKADTQRVSSIRISNRRLSSGSDRSERSKRHSSSVIYAKDRS